MELFRKLARLFKRSKPQSTTDSGKIEDQSDDDPTTIIKSECDKLEEEIATVIDTKSARLAVESKEHQKTREELNQFLDRIAAKSKVG